MPELVSAAVGVVGVAGLAAVAWVPARVRYAERVTVAAPPDEVFAAIVRQRDLMAWSAWPAATGMGCRVEGPDGRVGARVVFLKGDTPMGDQTVTAVVPGERVVLALSDPSPFRQTPVVTFDVAPAGDGRTDVTLSFDNRIARPFHLTVRLLGLPGWVRDLHRKDLAGLKAYCERRPAAA